jgi:endonuclease YncB( thermonuclease family)
MHLVMAAPFQQPGQPASTSTGGTVTVRVQDGERHRIRFNGRDIPAAA